MKILFGALVVNGAGRLNGHVIRRSPSGAVLQRLALPRSRYSFSSNPKFGQIQNVLHAYKRLTDTEKLQLKNFAEANPVPDKFGQLINIGGRAMFQKLQFGFDPNLDDTINTATLATDPQYVTVFFGQNNTSEGTVTVQFEQLTAPTRIKLSACFVGAPGSAWLQAKSREIYTDVINDNVVHTYDNVLTHASANLQPLAWMIVRLRCFNTSGWLTTDLFVYFKVSDIVE